MKHFSAKNSFLLFLLTVVFVGLAFFLKTPSIQNPKPITLSAIKSSNNLNTYISKDLKISLEYLKGWFVEDEYPFVLISNFKSSLHNNFQLKDDQIEILLWNKSLCQDTIEKNLIYGGCGENQKVLNVILNKEVKIIPSGNTYYKFLVQYPDKSETWSYYLGKGEKVLQISKKPDPSQFEKEFEDLVNSILFID